ncbi:deoxyribonuclease II [Trichinella nativa]|uniref:Deoxyribonuclease II n=1 Tax=Trichinella nativa TaxID=6335 RepID=A0A1Y3EK82_9BILA|nr:deoxyribonuclease II [Trichinella nativa]
MFIFYIIALYTLHLGVTPTDYQCKEQNNDVDWFFVYKLPGGKSSHHLLPNAATDCNYPPHFKFELPMSPGKGVIMAEDNNKGFWLVHTAKYFPNLALAIGDLFSNEKITKEAAAFLCMSYSDVNLRAIAKIIDYEQPIVFFAQKSATVPALYDSTEIQKLVNGLHKYQPTASASGDGIATLTPPGTVKIFASAPVGYSSGPITVRDTEIPIRQDSARWSVPKSDSDFICLSNTGRTANNAKYGASVACVLSKEAADLFRKMITKENLDACP